MADGIRNITATPPIKCGACGREMRSFEMWMQGEGDGVAGRVRCVCGMSAAVGASASEYGWFGAESHISDADAVERKLRRAMESENRG